MDARETTIFNAVLIASVIIGGILVFLIVSMIRLHRRQLRADREHASMELKLIEQERGRIAADLHDELGPVLSAAKFRIAAVRDIRPEDERRLSEAVTYIDSIVARVREIANGLMPSSLLRKGPEYAIRELMQTLSRETGPAMKLEVTELPKFSGAVAIHVYRIMQEMLHNSLRHADAGNIQLAMVADQQWLQLSCTDDGKGFVPAHNGGAGQGMRNILVRTEMLGGKMYVDSGKGHGTHIYCKVPLTWKNSDPVENK